MSTAMRDPSPAEAGARGGSAGSAGSAGPAGGAARAVRLIHRGAERHWVGDGFLTTTVFSYQELGHEISPFLLLDYGGPVAFEATNKRRGVGEHPHRGFETVTIVYEGQIEHRDSGGGGGTIGPGDVQWMTAGSGVIHEEMHTRDFAAQGGTMEMAQLWVNLPARFKMTPPRYQSLGAASFPTVGLPQGGGSARIIAGELFGARGPAQTFTPLQLWDISLAAGHRASLPIPAGHTAALLVVRGQLHFQGAAEVASPSDLVLFEREGTNLEIEAVQNSRVLVMAGEPIDEPIAGYGPFVMNSREEIQQAFDDLRAGRFTKPAHA